MAKTVDLRTGSITKSLVALALPLMGMSFIQMAYNLTDMFWIGRLGAGPVASVGTGGLLIWLATGIHTIAQLGGQIYVAQNLGKGDNETAGQYATASIQLSFLVCALMGLIFFLGRVPIISFFQLNSPDVVRGAETYIAIVGGLVLLQLMAKLLTALITTTGDSRTPFLATTAGLILNIILDPILIFGWFGLPAMGIGGAAIATVAAQAVVLLLLVYHATKGGVLFTHVKLTALPPVHYFKRIMRLGLPTTLQATFFPVISMVVSRMVASFGDNAVAVQRIGSQVESISWMTTEGFAIAVNSFIAQNYGGGDLLRAKEGYYRAMGMLACLGTGATALLILAATPIFQLFIEDAAVVAMGHDYLVILGVSQLFLCAEILSNNTMSALGRTLIPAIIVSIFTLIRIPMAMALTQTALGLNGIWWSIAISTITKGALLTALVVLVFRNLTGAPKRI